MWVITSVAVVILGASEVFQASGHADCIAALSDLQSRCNDLTACRVVISRDVDQSRFEVTHELVVLQSGLFRATDSWSKHHTDAKEKHDRETRKNHAYFDGVRIMASEPGSSSLYSEQPLTNWSESAPGPGQWMMCPWPVVTRYARWLMEAKDLRCESVGDVHTAESRSARLRLKWASDGRLLEVGMISSDIEYVLYRFDGFELRQASPPIPTKMIRLISSSSGRADPVNREDRFTVNMSRTTAEDPGLSFDPVALNLNRYDIESGDVTAPDGTFLYNMKEREEMMNRQSFWYRFRPWALSAGGVVLLIGMFHGYRRWRATA